MSAGLLLFLLSTFFLSGSLHGKTYLSDLEIDVPKTWSVKKYGDGLKFTIPVEEGAEFTPELFLRVRKGAIYIDDASGAKFSSVIRKVSEAANSKNVYVRDPRVMILKKNTKALFYQTDVERLDRKLVQTHLVVSSRTKHYILSYTDVPEAYESEKDQNYQLAWAMMNSIVIKSGNGPSRELQAYLFLKIIVILLVTAIGVKYFRKYLAARVYIGGPQADILARLPEGVVLIEVKAVAMGYQREFTRPSPSVNRSAAYEIPKSNLSQNSTGEVSSRLDSSIHPTRIQKFNSQPGSAISDQIEYVSEDPDAKSLSEVSEAVDDVQDFDKKVFLAADEEQWDVEAIEEPSPQFNAEVKRDPVSHEQKFPDQSVAEQSVAEQSVAEQSVAEQSVAEPAVAEQSVAEPAIAEQSVAEQSVAEQSVAEPAVAEQSVAEPAVAEPAVAEPAVAEPAVAENKRVS